MKTSLKLTLPKCLLLPKKSELPKIELPCSPPVTPACTRTRPLTFCLIFIIFSLSSSFQRVFRVLLLATSSQNILKKELLLFRRISCEFFTPAIVKNNLVASTQSSVKSKCVLRIICVNLCR